MKTRLLSLLAFLAILATSRAEPDSSPAGPKLIQTYADVLAVIPEEFGPKHASQWTEEKKSMVNVILKENVVDPHTRAKFQATVSQVAHWPDLTLFWEVPNPEGYHIRVFAHFTDDWKARISMLNIGDPVVIEGTFFKADFENLWGDSTLCLCLGNSTFTKEATTSGQTNAAPAVRKTTVEPREAVAPAEHFRRGNFDSPALTIELAAAEKTKAKLVVNPRQGVLTFADTNCLSDTRGFEFNPGEISLPALTGSDRQEVSGTPFNFAEPFYNPTMWPTHSEVLINDSQYIEASLVQSATFEMTSDNAVHIILRMEKMLLKVVQLSNS